jgi:hypothetical protein
MEEESKKEVKIKNSCKIMKHASETHCITCVSKAKLQFLNNVKRNIKIAILFVLAAFYKNMLQNFPELHMLKNK